MPDSRAVEAQYFKDTSIFPIMHSLVLKSAVLDAHPWVGMNLVKAFTEAKNRSVERLSDVTASHAPLAWMDSYHARI
jgi:4,5-dihydroxyphthalate decarboxylase